MLNIHLLEDQKAVVDEVLFALALSTERDAEMLYRQGVADCIRLLKTLSVL